MQLTARRLNRAALDRQLLLDRRDIGVADAVRAVCALQAQSAASPYIALWSRVRAFDPAEVDRAFAEHRVVKATLMRIALHAVSAEDYPAFHLWRPAPERGDAIEVTAFHALDDATWDELEAEARSPVAFLADRQPDVHRRYAHWWTRLPSAEVRVLAG